MRAYRLSAMLEIENVSKHYGETCAVDQLSLHVPSGELLVLLGSSGCGKTTTLKMINRLIEPSSGTIRIAGTDARGVPGPELRRGIGYSFQEVGLFPHMSVAENISVTLDLLGWDEERARERVDELMALVELASREFRSRYPHQLSGGQQQRVGLARALAAAPKLMLLDEPFGALDPLTRDRLQREFARLHRELGLTTVFVTHDMVEAILLGDRVAVLEEGRLVQVGTPAELMRQPASPYVRELMGTPERQARMVESLLRTGSGEGSASE